MYPVRSARKVSASMSAGVRKCLNRNIAAAMARNTICMRAERADNRFEWLGNFDLFVHGLSSLDFLNKLPIEVHDIGIHIHSGLMGSQNACH